MQVWYILACIQEPGRPGGKAAEPGVLPAGAGGGQAGGLSLPEPGQLLCAGGPGLDRGCQGGGSYQGRYPLRDMAQEAADFRIQHPPGT